MKRFYTIKPGVKEVIKKHIKFTQLAEIVGLNASYMSEIVNGRRQDISKTTAYAITKAISPNLEINDLFNVVDR